MITDFPSEHSVETSTTHILRFMEGGSVTGTFNETSAQWGCVWDLPPGTSKARRAKLLVHYVNWRNSIFNAWATKTGKTVMIINLR